MGKVERIFEMIPILRENPDISAKELAERLSMDLRAVYRYIKQLRQIGILTELKLNGLKEKSQPIVYDGIERFNMSLSQHELFLIHKSIEAMLQNLGGLKELNESEIQTLEKIEEWISKALLIRPVLAPASINFLFEPIKEKSDGEVNIGLVGGFEMSKPLHLASSTNVLPLFLIFSRLFTYNKGKPEEVLVKSWNVSDDLLTWSFDLKEGIKFHNGKELTAEDVEFTYRCISDPEFNQPLAFSYSFVKSFDAISKYKFQIKLKNPNVALLDMLGTSIFPKEALQKYRKLKRIDPQTMLIGSGPFKFDSFPQDDVMILKANEDYFEEGYPHLDKVILRAYSTSRDLFNAAALGEVDIGMFGLMLSELEQLGKTIPFQIYPFDTLMYYALLFNLKDETLTDIKVRKAVSHAIDRESLIRRQLRGYGKVINGPWTPSSWAYNEKLQPVTYDIELTKSLLVEAGWKEKEGHWQKGNEKLELEIAVNRGDIPDVMRLAIGLKLQLQKLKIKVKIRYLNPGDLASNKFQSALLSINCGGDPDKLWRFWHSGSKINLASYHNPEVDELLELGRRVVSISGRKAIYDRIQELIVLDHPAAFLCTSVSLMGSNCVLQNAEEFLTIPNFFSSIESWTIKRKQG